MTTGKTIALTRWTFVGKVISLLFNVMSSFFTAFLPRSVFSWLQSPSAMILEPKKINPEYSLEGLMFKLKLQYLGHLMQSRLTGEDPDEGSDGGQQEKGATEEEMVEWDH